MGSPQKFAYFRDKCADNQCNLSFKFEATLGDVEICEEIKSTRQITDTVASLLQHTANKLNNLVKVKRDCPAEEYKELEFPIDFINWESGKSIKRMTTLNDLLKNFAAKGVEFRICDQKYFVLFNAPLVRDLELPSVFFAGFNVQPSKFRILYADRNTCKFAWYKSKDKVKWSRMGTSYIQPLKKGDVGYYLKLECTPSFNKLEGPTHVAESACQVEEMDEIPVCPYDERHKFTKVKQTGDKFRIVSYNVLSCRYTDNEQFPYCDKKHLSIDYRKQLIGRELAGYKADIICLQEVDSVAYMSHYKGLFSKDYMSFFHKKGNRLTEGLACFLKTERFKMVEQTQIVFSEEIQSNPIFGYLWKMVQSKPEVQDLFLRQGTSLHVTILKEKLPKGSQLEKNHVIVANTHLFYHPEAEHIRLIQINMATTFLSDLRKKLAKSGQVCVIFCGDFNSKPDSDVLKYMTTGKINRNDEVAQRIGENVDLYHSFKFKSSCGSPKYTNYTDTFKDCLDYIFIEGFKLKVSNVVPLPSEEELAEYEGLPNRVYPSDHLALVVDLEYI